MAVSFYLAASELMYSDLLVPSSNKKCAVLFSLS